MERRRCGEADLELSVLGLGCWKFGGGEYWGEVPQDEADAAVRRALDLGVNYFDTAEAYNDGRSEESLGKALKGISRDRVVVGTKISPSNAEPETLVRHCDASLKRLATDYIDVYMVHWPINPPAVAHYASEKILPSATEAFAALLRLQEQGKIRHIGVSNFGAETMEEAMSTGARIAVNQLPYNLLSRAIEAEALPFCREHGIGVVAYFPLAQALLTGKYRNLDEIPPMHARTRHFDSRRPGSQARHGEEGAEPEVEAALAALREISGETDVPMGDLALGWAAAREGITCVLAGSTNLRHLEDNAKALERPLSPDLLARLDSATQPLSEKLGPGFDYYENTANDRTRLWR
jgi:aryl-alcohol dehydrogenase-like predicted oxidoreductase